MAPFLPYKLKTEKVVKFFIYPESQHRKNYIRLLTMNSVSTVAVGLKSLMSLVSSIYILVKGGGALERCGPVWGS